MYWSTTFDSAVVREVPDVIEDLGAGHDLAGVAHQQLEERHLLGRQRDLHIAAPRPVPRRIQAQVADLEHRRARTAPTADQRAHPRRELGEAERLGQVVVGPGVQTAHPVVDPSRAVSRRTGAQRSRRRGAGGRPRGRRCPGSSTSSTIAS